MQMLQGNVSMMFVGLAVASRVAGRGRGTGATAALGSLTVGAPAPAPATAPARGVEAGEALPRLPDLPVKMAVRRELRLIGKGKDQEACHQRCRRVL